MSITKKLEREEQKHVFLDACARGDIDTLQNMGSRVACMPKMDKAIMRVYTNWGYNVLMTVIKLVRPKTSIAIFLDACARSDLEVVRLISKHGATDWLRALEIATSKGNIELAEMALRGRAHDMETAEYDENGQPHFKRLEACLANARKNSMWYAVAILVDAIKRHNEEEASMRPRMITRQHPALDAIANSLDQISKSLRELNEKIDIVMAADSVVAEHTRAQ
jgi:hypothetical protein